MTEGMRRTICAVHI